MCQGDLLELDIKVQTGSSPLYQANLLLGVGLPLGLTSSKPDDLAHYQSAYTGRMMSYSLFKKVTTICPW